MLRESAARSASSPEVSPSKAPEAEGRQGGTGEGAGGREEALPAVAKKKQADFAKRVRLWASLPSVPAAALCLMKTLLVPVAGGFCSATMRRVKLPPHLQEYKLCLCNDLSRQLPCGKVSSLQ